MDISNPDRYTHTALAREARQRRGRFTVAHFIQIMIIFAGVAVIFSRLTSQELQSHHIKWNNEEITLQEPWGDAYVIPYGNILSVQLVQPDDYGTWVRGIETEHSCYGIWHRDDYGDYHLFVRKDLSSAILLETSEGNTLLNLESEDVTSQLYGLLLEKSGTS